MLKVIIHQPARDVARAKIRSRRKGADSGDEKHSREMSPVPEAGTHRPPVQELFRFEGAAVLEVQRGVLHLREAETPHQGV